MWKPAAQSLTAKHLDLETLLLCLVARSCLTLCDGMDYSTPGFAVLHYLPESAQTRIHWVDDAIQPSVTTFSSCPQSFPASGSFPMSQLFLSGGQSIGASASTSVLPKSNQSCFPLALTDLISLLFKGLSKVFYSTTIWKHQFFSAQPSLWSNSTGKTIALTRGSFVGNVISPAFEYTI